MKRNIYTLVLLSAVALSSCSVTNKMAATANVNDDDVYFTRAAAGDQPVFADMNNYQQENNNDDYYYYGDYASRINRFSYLSPFDYSDEFYYTYVPYNNGFGLGDNIDQSYYYGNSTSPANNAVAETPYIAPIYSPYDYGSMPYYDMSGYDDMDYGGMYISYLYGGGGRHFRHQSARPVYATGGSSGGGSSNPGLVFRRANAGTGAPITSSVIYPGRPSSLNPSQTSNVNTRAVRPSRNDNQPAIQRTFNTSPAPSQSSSSSSSGSSGSSGGGGRPVRP